MGRLHRETLGDAPRDIEAGHLHPEGHAPGCVRWGHFPSKRHPDHKQGEEHQVIDRMRDR